jgi:hypothetical protein
MSYGQFDGKVVLTDGTEIECVLFEDPDGHPGGRPLFWVEPVRVLADGERADHFEATVLGTPNAPGEDFFLSFRWPGVQGDDGGTPPLQVVVQDMVTGEVLQDYPVGHDPLGQ